MHIRAQTHVVGQVPAYIVGVLIDDYAIAVPVPVVAVAIVVLGYVEVKAVEPEAVGPAAGQHKHVAGAKAAVVVTVLPGMIEVVMSIVAPVFVANPSAVIAVDMGRIGMPFAVAKAALVAVAMFVTITMLVTIAVVIVVVSLRPVMRNVLVVVVAITIVIAVPVMIVMILSHGVKAKGKDYDEKSDESLHRQEPPCRWKIRWDYSTGNQKIAVIADTAVIGRHKTRTDTARLGDSVVGYLTVGLNE